MEEHAAGWRAAVDIGGTFTDVVLVDEEGRCRAVGKSLTTPDDPGRGLVEGLRRLLEDAQVPVAQLGDVVHGTTLVTNALIERAGAPTGLITTEGMRDVLEIGSESRYDLYDLDLAMPVPLVPRRWRVEVPERVMADGEVRQALDAEAVRAQARRLAGDGVTSVAILFLHSYRWDRHERDAAQAVLDECPQLDVTTSAEVLPELGEYARASTTAANAYVRPLVRRYLLSLQTRVHAVAPAATVSLVTSTGRVTPLATAARAPIRLLESGPAGGVLAAAGAADLAGIADCLAFDMGGTTAKASYVVEGRPRLGSSFEVARVRRFVRGSGLPIQLPSIELIEIGAGGGSIAWVDGLGLLRVGPRSAGSDPGPACYGFGGTEATVTDADLLLGHLDAGSFLGGGMAIDHGEAERALGRLATALAVPGPHEAARAVRRVVDEQMAAAARMHAVEQGLDPARFALVATGGAGPVHACSVARILGLARVLVPARAGVASAHGFLRAPFGFDAARSLPARVGELDWPVVRVRVAELEAEAAAASQGRAHTRAVEADLRYEGQGHVVMVPVSDEVLGAGDGAALADALAREYRLRYGRVPEGNEVEVLTWRVALTGPVPELLPLRAAAAAAETRTRPVYFEEGDAVRDTPVVSRADASGFGPMIVEERESTLVVPPGARVTTVGGSAVLVEL